MDMIRLLFKMFFLIAIPMLVTSVAGADNEACGTLSVRSRAHLYVDQEADEDMGFSYPPGMELVIASIESGMAKVTWRHGDNVEAGEGYIRRSSFDTEAFDALIDQCRTTPIPIPTPRPDRPEDHTHSTDLSGVNIRTSDDYSCLPARVKAKLNEMVARGWDVQLMSAHRSRRDNQRRGGARNSLHIQCRAADFIVNGQDREVVEDYLLATWSGGLGLYCSTRFHIDNGNHRIWGGCASSTDRRRYYSRGADQRRDRESSAAER